SPYLALWNRVAGFDPDELQRAFADQRVVKAQLFRITLHAVVAADYPAFHEAMERTLRGARLYDRRFRSEGVSIEDTMAIVPDLLAFAAIPRGLRARDDAGHRPVLHDLPAADQAGARVPRRRARAARGPQEGSSVR